MRTYRRVWRLLVPVALVAGLVVASRHAAWGPALAATSIVGPLGALLRYSLLPRVGLRSGPVLRWGVNAAGGTLLVCALSGSVGAWALLVLPLWAGSSPELVAGLVHARRRRRPLPRDLHAWTDLEIGRRWRTSAEELRRSTTGVGRRVVLVEERSRLLDEIERRDPRRYEAELARAGWQADEISER